ncbi:hypothetical protein N9W99_00170 [Gammaproteobacteria bacterium]|nr:hypothetical protein [Gammaproteobacteria bacterium]
MSIYKCNECGMSVKTSCGECNTPLVDGTLDLDNGSQVKISQCQEADCANYNGKIKSPLCCGNDMHCTIG